MLKSRKKRTARKCKEEIFIAVMVITVGKADARFGRNN